MTRRSLVAVTGSIGAWALVASLAIAAAGSAGTASTAATATTAKSLVATITPPRVPNAAAIKKQYGGRSITFLGDGPVGKSHTRDQLLVAKFFEVVRQRGSGHPGLLLNLADDESVGVRRQQEPEDSQARFGAERREHIRKSGDVRLVHFHIGITIIVEI